MGNPQILNLCVFVPSISLCEMSKIDVRWLGWLGWAGLGWLGWAGWAGWLGWLAGWLGCPSYHLLLFNQCFACVLPLLRQNVQIGPTVFCPGTVKE